MPGNRPISTARIGVRLSQDIRLNGALKAATLVERAADIRVKIADLPRTAVSAMIGRPRLRWCGEPRPHGV